MAPLLLRGALLTLLWRQSAAEPGACPNAERIGDPFCRHGGTLHAEASRDAASCAACDCPPAWGGVDCSLCRSLDACPPRAVDGAPPRACTTSRLVPSREELQQGKLLSCACGGDDAAAALCALLPQTHVAVSLRPDGARPGAQLASLRLYAGVPSALFEPPSATAFAYPAYWAANFSACAWQERECVDPLPEGRACLFFECAHGAVACPPPEVPPCPGYNRPPHYLCDEGPDGVRSFQHHCNPLLIPWNVSMQARTLLCFLLAASADNAGLAQLFCLADPSPDETWLCYFRRAPRWRLMPRPCSG